MKTVTKYCWLKPDLTFSGSWTDSSLNSRSLLKEANKKGYKLIKYKVQTGDLDFEFPYGAAIINPKSTK